MAVSPACRTTQVLAPPASLATSSPTAQVSLTACLVRITANTATDQLASTASLAHSSAIPPVSSARSAVLRVLDQPPIALPASWDTLSPLTTNAAMPNSTAIKIAPPALKPTLLMPANHASLALCFRMETAFPALSDAPSATPV